MPGGVHFTGARDRRRANARRFEGHLERLFV
jgi:hypothetical protein